MRELLRKSINAPRKPNLFLAISLLVLAISHEAWARTDFIDENRGVLTVAPLIEKAAPAVVNISVRTHVPAAENPLYRDPFFRRFFGLPETLPKRDILSAGSGVIVDAAKGYVLTNHHVLEKADEVSVRLRDGRQFTAKLIGSDAATDIGLLQIDAGGLAALSFGDSDALKVGDFVIAIGNPFGLGQTVTSGIVSALGRSGISREKFEDFIQTDAPINPGNSGGALIDPKGELVGINTAIIAPGGGNVGIGFAVPAKMARAVMAQLIRHGEVRRGRIGISIQDITPDIALALDLPLRAGALISQVEKGSPAEKAGLLLGDAIVAVDGAAVADSNDVRNSFGLRERGSKVKLTIIRKGKRKEVTVRIGAPLVSKSAPEVSLPKLAGAKFTDIPTDHPAKAKWQGVHVADVAAESIAWRFGLRKGDIILAVNRNEIASLDEFEQAVKAAGRVLALDILRGDSRLFVVVG